MSDREKFLMNVCGVFVGAITIALCINLAEAGQAGWAVSITWIVGALVYFTMGMIHGRDL